LEHGLQRTADRRRDTESNELPPGAPAADPARAHHIDRRGRRRPTITAAARGYTGPATGATLPLACATNFGGVQEDATAYSTGAIVRHLRQALAMPASETRELRERLRILHDVRAIQGAHLALYDNLCNSGRAA
jgi:hypothetical protein